MERKFGVELEMIANISRGRVASLLRRRDLQVTHGWSCDYSRWTVKTDCSVTRGRFGSGTEVVTPILSGEQGLAELNKAVTAMVRQQTRVQTNDPSVKFIDNSCGLHVHVDISDLTFEQQKNFVWFYLKFEDAIYSLVGKHRSTGTYAKKYKLGKNITKNLMKGFRHLDSLKRHNRAFCDRYHGLNLAHLHEGRVEFRLHEGTMNIEQIEAWVRLLDAMIVRAKSDVKIPDHSKVWTLKRLFKIIGWDQQKNQPKIGRHRQILEAKAHAA